MTNKVLFSLFSLERDVKEMFIINRRLFNKVGAGLVSLVVAGVMVLNLGLVPSALGQSDLTQGKASQPFQIVISLAEGMDVDKVAQDFGAEVVRRGPLQFATLEFKGTKNPSQTSQPTQTSQTSQMPQVLTALKATPGILGAEENYRRSITTLSKSTVPNDPLFQDQWSMVRGNVQGAWDMGATGQGITIAVVDTGVALGHPDLRANLVPGYNAITESEEPGANQDANGHGTHVAGIAAAERNNVGIVGVAYQAKIMPIKVTNSMGDGYDFGIVYS